MKNLTNYNGINTTDLAPGGHFIIYITNKGATENT